MIGKGQAWTTEAVDKIGDKNAKEPSQPRRSTKKKAPGKHAAREESSLGAKGHGYQEIVGQLVAGKFRLIKMLGSGSYGKWLFWLGRRGRYN